MLFRTSFHFNRRAGERANIEKAHRLESTGQSKLEVIVTPMEAQDIPAIGRYLSPNHLELLIKGSNIASDVIEERGYFTATVPEEVIQLGFGSVQARVPALVIPVRDVSGEIVFHRIRPDDPRPDPKRPGRFRKYEQPQAIPLVLDVPPRVHEHLADVSRRLWVVEGERKADALVSVGELAVGLLGVWAWKRGGLPLPDWDRISIIGREVVVCFDSDASWNVNVRMARTKLAHYLSERGAG
jgi:putative DNA primase/helicase